MRVQPRAARNEVAGIDGDFLRVRLTAPPVEGEANRQLQKFMGEVFHCSPGAVQIVRGDTGRLKLIEIAGITGADAVKAVSLRLQGQAGPERKRARKREQNKR